jgi:hypothetical protein
MIWKFTNTWPLTEPRNLHAQLVRKFLSTCKTVSVNKNVSLLIWRCVYDVILTQIFLHTANGERNKDILYNKSSSKIKKNLEMGRIVRSFLHFGRFRHFNLRIATVTEVKSFMLSINKRTLISAQMIFASFKYNFPSHWGYDCHKKGIKESRVAQITAVCFIHDR